MRTVVAVVVGLGLLAVPITLAGRGSDDGAAGLSTVVPVAADDVVDAVGINTHVAYFDTTYADFDGTVRPALQDLGVRHVRDHAYTVGPRADRDDVYYRRLRELAEDGMRFSLVTDIATPLRPRTDLGVLPELQGWVGGALDTLEGPNEPELSGLPDWPARAMELQRGLARTVRNAPELADVRLAAFSLSRPDALDEVDGLSAVADAANVHHYPDGLCLGCAPPYGRDVDDVLARHAAALPDRPLLLTETGYHTALRAPAEGHRPASEEAAAVYLPRLVLDAVARGVDRMFLYELLDQRPDERMRDKEQHFGLLRADGTRKPAFAALRNLIEVLDDPGPPVDLQALDYGVRAPDGAQVGHQLLQRRDGTHVLALWRDAVVWDTGDRRGRDDVAARGPLSSEPVDVEVAFGAPFASIVSRVPRTGTGVEASWTGRRSITVPLGADLVLLELRTEATASGCSGAAPPFVDVGAVFGEPVACLAERGIVVGAADRFRPSAEVTRGEAAAILLRAAEDAHGGPLPRDCGAGPGVFGRELCTLGRHGVVLGFTTGDLRTGAQLRRGQAAGMVAGVLDLLDDRDAPAATSPPVLVDVRPDDVFGEQIARLTATGRGTPIVQGSRSGRFEGGRTVTRGEFAAVVHRMLEHLAPPTV